MRYRARKLILAAPIHCLVIVASLNSDPICGLQVLGTDDLYNYLSKYGIELDPQLENLVGRHAKRPWSKFTNAENSHLVTPEGMDFLDKLLKYDHQVSYKKPLSCTCGLSLPFRTSAISRSVYTATGLFCHARRMCTCC